MIESNDKMKDFDLMMKSILDEGREEVPAHVWEGVSAGLDKAARRKTVVLWWRRAAVSVAAAAAVTVGVIFNMDRDTDSFVPQAEEKGMIAVVEPVQEPAVEDKVEDIPADEAEVVRKMQKVMIAEAEVPETVSDNVPSTAAEAMETVSDMTESVQEEPSEAKQKATENVDRKKVTDERVYFPEDWGEDEEEKPARRVSFELSGLAGTNNTQSQNRIGPMKRPTASPAPKETGIEETSTKGSYNIPVSFGAGVKIGLSPRWSIGTGVRYTRLSRQFYGKYTKVGTDGSLANPISSDIHNLQQYIGIPVNAYCDIVSNDMINLYAYAGGTAEKCVSDRYSVLGTDIIHKENVDGLQLSANAGIGVEFLLGKHVGLYIDPSLRYYFNNGQPKSIRTVQPLMLGFEMGIRARL